MADKLIIIDQGSTDGSAELLAKHADDSRVVVLTDAPRKSYDLPRIRNALIREARKVSGTRVLLSLDADECLSAAALEPSAWAAVMNAEPGTAISFPWFQLVPGADRGWFAERLVVGLVDDGRVADDEPPLHEPRVPGPVGRIVEVDDIAVLHYQTAEPERWRSKQRWYQCLELVEFPRKRAAEIYRQYHERDPALRDDIVSTPSVFFRGYEDRGIDMRHVEVATRYRWDAEVVRLLVEHGPAYFRKLDIWEANWPQLAQYHGVPLPGPLNDPRSHFDRAVMRWLRYAQPRRRSRLTRAVSRALQAVSW